MANLTRAQIEDYARSLIEDRANDVDYQSIFECWGYHIDLTADGLPEAISEEDGRKVHDLIGNAVITVTFPGED